MTSIDMFDSPDIQTTADSPPEGSDEHWRRCNRCFEMLPITAFRYARRDQGLRHSICTHCSVAADRQRRQGDRGRATDRWITAACDKRSAAALSAAVEEMVHRCGGMRRFVDRWRLAIERSSQEGRAASVLRAYGFVMKLALAAAELTPGLDTLGDDELSAKLDSHVLRLLEAKPSIVAEILRRAGWQLIPAASDPPPAPQANGAGQDLG